MATMNISLPGKMKAWVEEQAESGRYSNSSDLVRDLIRREQMKAEKITHVQKLLDEGVASGPGKMTKDELLESAKAQVKARLANTALAS